VKNDHDAGDFVSVKRWGQAKREVTALWPLISQKLAQGISVRQAWIELHGTGEISVCQSKFYVQVNRRLQPQQQTTTSRTAGRDLVARAAPLSPVTVSDKREPLATVPLAPDPTAKFVHNNRPSVDLDDW